MGIADVLSVIAVGHLELSAPPPREKGGIGGTRVQGDGRIYLPHLGSLPAAGRTVLEIQEDLRERLKEYVAEPQAVVDVIEYASQRFYVLGDVLSPGVFPVDGRATVLEALGLAGGITEAGDVEGAYVMRRGRLLPVSLADLVHRGDPRGDVPMEHGDVIFVPSLGDRRVYVLGEVTKPGRFPIDRHGMTLLDAISLAGGLDHLHADRKRIYLFRGGWRHPEMYTLTTADIHRWGADIHLRPWDRIVVGPKGLANWSRAMILLTPFLQTSVNAALAAAAFSN